jgi:(p)ppGpp synthase/HD superfamily hydrolase
MVERARRFALKAHEGQKYGDEFPYFVHLLTAFSVARRFEFADDVILCSVLLHDVLEDTEHDYEELESLFGVEIAKTVACVTEPKGMTRKERHFVTYPRIRANTNAVIVKLCDRISHVEFGGAKVKMYAKEHHAFKAALYAASQLVIVDQMWQYLDDLLAEV